MGIGVDFPGAAHIEWGADRIREPLQGGNLWPHEWLVPIADVQASSQTPVRPPRSLRRDGGGRGSAPPLDAHRRADRPWDLSVRYPPHPVAVGFGRVLGAGRFRPAGPRGRRCRGHRLGRGRLSDPVRDRFDARARRLRRHRDSDHGRQPVRLLHLHLFSIDGLPQRVEPFPAAHFELDPRQQAALLRGRFARREHGLECGRRAGSSSLSRLPVDSRRRSRSAISWCAPTERMGPAPTPSGSRTRYRRGAASSARGTISR